MNSTLPDSVIETQRLIFQGAERLGRAFRVLIVDDEPWAQETLADYCASSEVIRADVVASVAEAKKRLVSDRYDLVTFDLIMPEASGLEGLQYVRQHQPHLPVLIVSGNATDRMMNEAGIAGAVQVIEKPVSLAKFMAAVWVALDRGSDTSSDSARRGGA